MSGWYFLKKQIPKYQRAFSRKHMIAVYAATFWLAPSVAFF
jgi:hypothetical protein